MEKMKIGIDIDEVVVEFFKGYLNLFNEKFEKNLKFEDLVKYHIWEITNVSREDALSLADYYHGSKDSSQIDFVDGAKDSILFLLNNFELVFITSRPVSVKENTEDFFKNHFGDFNFEIYFSGDMHGGKKSKAEFCNELGIKFMIEDNADYALDCAKNGVKTFLLDKPWNKNYENHENLVKVNNWEELLEKLKW
jgi:uncharacterized HAD superfamily protein